MGQCGSISVQRDKRFYGWGYGQRRNGRNFIKYNETETMAVRIESTETTRDTTRGSGGIMRNEYYTLEVALQQVITTAFKDYVINGIIPHKYEVIEKYGAKYVVFTCEKKIEPDRKPRA